MLKYPCLILDHDDTVVQSEATVNYPFFCYILDHFRPGTRISLEAYIRGCFHPGFVEMCRQHYHFTDKELQIEHQGWKDYVRTHIPNPYPGIARIIQRQLELGGKIFVVSHSSREIIIRDYQAHFGIVPDEIFGCELPANQWKPSTYPLKQIMNKYGFTEQEMLVVDDLKPGWQMARDAGVKIVFAAWSKLGVPEIVKEMTGLCDYSFHTVRDLEAFLFDNME